MICYIFIFMCNTITTLICNVELLTYVTIFNDISKLNKYTYIYIHKISGTHNGKFKNLLKNIQKLNNAHVMIYHICIIVHNSIIT